MQGTPLTERFGGELIASIGTARPTTRWVKRSLRKYLSGQNILILKDLFKLYSSEELVCFQTVFFGRPILLKLSSFEGSVRFQFFSSLKGPVFVIKLFSFLGRVLLLKA